VKIGGKWWMAENLNYDTYGSKCYDNKNANCDKYGRLYKWDAAERACPVGFHLSTSEEWDTLLDNVGDSSGTKLKATRGWNSNGNGTDDYGFSALPGGYYFVGESSKFNKFNDVGDDGYWWSDGIKFKSSSMKSVRGPHQYHMTHSLDSVDEKGGGVVHMRSVRCVQD
jgi:uncharacterized protein (TIGR02145 family)